MPDSGIAGSGADEAPKSAHEHALTPQAAELLRAKAKPYRPEEKFGPEAIEPGTNREEPLSAFMIDPKYLPKQQPQADREPALQGAAPAMRTVPRDPRSDGESKNFYEALAVPMAADRIRRTRPSMSIPIRDLNAENFWEEDRPQDTHHSLGARAGMAFGAVAAALAGGLELIRDGGTKAWKWASHLGERPDYSMERGTRQQRVSGISPYWALIVPLATILAVLALGAATGSFSRPPSTPSSPSGPTNPGASNGASTQNGSADGTSGSGSGNGGSTSGPGTTGQQNGSAATQQNSGTSPSTPVQPNGSSSGSASGAPGTTTPTSPSITIGPSGLPVGGRGGGDEAPVGVIPATQPVDGSGK
jgi:hypothetical protein